MTSAERGTETPPRGRRSSRSDDALRGALRRAIREARVASGITMDGLAKATGLPYKTISRIELGQNLPSLPVFVRIADVLGISLDALLGRAFESPERRAGTGDRRGGEAGAVQRELEELRRRMDLLERELGQAHAP